MSKYILLLVMLLSSVFATASTGEGGGDAFELSSQYKTWDALEYGDPIDPTEFPSVYSLIESQLSKLKTVLPITSDYLKGFFFEKRPMWWLVQPELRDIEDGDSFLKLTYNKVQVAINSRGLIQIHEPTWNQLDDISRAYLFLHEILWGAVGYNHVFSPSIIRKLVGILMNPYLDKLNKQNLSDLLLPILPKSSKFAKKIHSDLGQIVIRNRIIKQPYQKCKIQSRTFRGKQSPRARHLCFTKRGNSNGHGTSWRVLGYTGTEWEFIDGGWACRYMHGRNNSSEHGEVKKKVEIYFDSLFSLGVCLSR